jgi:hypothetical protein
LGARNWIRADGTGGRMARHVEEQLAFVTVLATLTPEAACIGDGGKRTSMLESENSVKTT